jgi:rhodanese-related sulfurtransferase
MAERMIDVREYPEFAGGHIAGSEWVRLSELQKASEGWDREEELLLVCRSGQRSQQAREMLGAKGFRNVRVLAGGVEQRVLEGGVLTRLPSRVWSMERQVRVIAGGMVVISLLLAMLVSRWFLIWTGVVGVGLVFAGVSDICMMATVLGTMPWNRARGG